MARDNNERYKEKGQTQVNEEEADVLESLFSLAQTARRRSLCNEQTMGSTIRGSNLGRS